jgi:hypothetical protein
MFCGIVTSVSGNLDGTEINSFDGLTPTQHNPHMRLQIAKIWRASSSNNSSVELPHIVDDLMLFKNSSTDF